MTKLLLASAAAIALMTGVAAAQSSVETTQVTVSPVPPPVTVITPAPITAVPPAPGYTSTTERSSFGGASVESKKTYENGPNGSVATSSEKVMRPDGSSQTTTHQEWSTSSMPPAPPPMPPANSSTTTTTTTIR